MTLYLLDVIATPREWEQRQIRKDQIEKAKEEAKEEKQVEKLTKKEAKAKRKAEKKAERAKKKAEKKAQKHSKDLSATQVSTVATVEVPAGQACQTTQAAMPTGVVLAVCASLLICFGSAWFYRRFNSSQNAPKP